MAAHLLSKIDRRDIRRNRNVSGKESQDIGRKKEIRLLSVSGQGRKKRSTVIMVVNRSMINSRKVQKNMDHLLKSTLLGDKGAVMMTRDQIETGAKKVIKVSIGIAICLLETTKIRHAKASKTIITRATTSKETAWAAMTEDKIDKVEVNIKEEDQMITREERI